MDKFKTVFRGYDKASVKTFIDNMIGEYEALLKVKEAQDKELENANEKLNSYKNLESTLNRAMLAAEESSNQIKKIAYQESQLIIGDAKKNANRILNDALLKAERTEADTQRLRRNIIIYKNKLKSIIETQLQIIDEIDKIDIKYDDNNE